MLFRDFVRKQVSAPLPCRCPGCSSSLCSYLLHHCGRNRKTDINGQSWVKRRRISVLSPSEHLLSWVRDVCAQFLGERKTQSTEWNFHCVSCFFSFNLRVPGPQDGERGPAVCWVAGSFLQRDLGQCLPQPHGRYYCVCDLQTAWLWGQWNPQHFCCS